MGSVGRFVRDSYDVVPVVLEILCRHVELARVPPIAVAVCVDPDAVVPVAYNQVVPVGRTPRKGSPVVVRIQLLEPSGNGEGFPPVGTVAKLQRVSHSGLRTCLGCRNM